VGHDDVDIEPHQFRRQGRQLVIPCLGPSELDHNILAFGVAEVAQPGAKGSNARGMPRRGDKTQIPDIGDLRPLRARRERPRRRAAEQRDELAPPQMKHWLPLHGRSAARSTCHSVASESYRRPELF
jgi:hypothetical protein